MSSNYIPIAIRREVMERALGRCEYCGSPRNVCPDPFSVEHIIPRALGGANTIENYALSCQGCNNIKATFIEATDPITGSIVPLYHPRQHRWSEHFVWSDDALSLIGRTPIGRATVERLQLNREGVVNLRSLLIAVGKHPPA